MRKSLNRLNLVSALILMFAASIFGAHVIDLDTSLIDESAEITTIGTGYSYGEGPAVDSSGDLYFADESESEIYKVTFSPSANVTLFDGDANTTKGIVFDNQNRMICTEYRGISCRILGEDKGYLYQGSQAGEANDLTLASDGGIFFTSPGSYNNPGGYVCYLSPDSVLTNASPRSTDFLNGIEYIEEADLIYVSATQGDKVSRYSVDESNELTLIDDFIDVTSPDGIAIDEHGNLWIASAGWSDHAIHVFDSSGTELGTITIDATLCGNALSNCCFGGVNNKTLYITGGSGVFMVETKVAGRSTRGEPQVSNRPEVKPVFNTNQRIANYPNPFNGSTLIRFSAAEANGSRPVSFNIYSVSGARILSLDGQKTATGGYQVTWDGKDAHGRKVNNGTYFCKINAGNNESTRKIILSR